MIRSLPIIRNYEAGKLLEAFFISAVAAILFTRFILYITGYPTLGGDNFHIAHLLWGGLLMLFSMVILLVFLSTRTKVIGAILGGIGFGLFIDELGKFITHDNNYFYQPAIALIYIILLSLFFLFRFFGRTHSFSQKEYLMNALMLLEEAVLNDMDRVEKEKYQEFLAEAGDYHHLTAKLKSLTGTLTVINPNPPRPLTKFIRLVARYYDRFIKSSLFNKVILIFFVAHFVTTLFTASLIVLLELTHTPSIPTPMPGNYLYLAWGELFSTLLSAGLAIAGVIYLKFSKFTAYRLLKYSVLVTILLTTFFSFYKMQLAALFGLIINLFLLVGLNQIIGRLDLSPNNDPKLSS